MEFGQVMEYNKRNFFFENHPENETERLVPDLLLFKKALYEVKASALSLVGKCSAALQSSTWHTIKTSCMKLQNKDSEIWSIFIFLEKGLGIVSPWYFVYDLSKKNISHVTLY